jgi:alanyl-tRNA synthetase
MCLYLSKSLFPMANRLYYEDAFVARFPAQIIDIREVSRADRTSVWQIALDRTAFYPTSGGQPFDTGSLTASSRTGAILEVPVESVEEDEQGEVWHYTRKPLAAGTEVEGVINWSRRLDHMQQHSGQHLLSAACARELNAPTVSFHLGETVSTIDLAAESLSAADLERVEDLANLLIAEDRPVATRTVDDTEAKRLLAAGRLRKLPDRSGPFRLVEIADYDLNACGGTHVKTTGQIGGLSLRGVERMGRGLRVEFVCGLRANRSARKDFALLGRASSLLSAGPEALPTAVERLKSEAAAGEKDRRRLREELASYHASRLAVEELVEDGLRLVRRVFPDRDPDYVRLLASRVAACVPQTAALLVSSESWPARVVLARSLNLGVHCGELMKETLAAHNLRGGGSPSLAQADVPESLLSTVCDTLVEGVRREVEASVAE